MTKATLEYDLSDCDDLNDYHMANKDRHERRPLCVEN